MAFAWTIHGASTVRSLSVHRGLHGLCIADARRLHGHFAAMQLSSHRALYQLSEGGATPNGAVETLKGGSKRHNGAESPKGLPPLLSVPRAPAPPGLVRGH